MDHGCEHVVPDLDVRIRCVTLPEGRNAIGIVEALRHLDDVFLAALRTECLNGVLLVVLVVLAALHGEYFCGVLQCGLGLVAKDAVGLLVSRGQPLQRFACIHPLHHQLADDGCILGLLTVDRVAEIGVAVDVVHHGVVTTPAPLPRHVDVDAIVAELTFKEQRHGQLAGLGSPSRCILVASVVVHALQL